MVRLLVENMKEHAEILVSKMKFLWNGDEIGLKVVVGYWVLSI